MNRVRLQIVCICIFFGAVIATGMEALTPGPPKSRRSTTGLKEAEPRAMRPEGERFSANGKIEQTGDRYTFYPSDDGPSLRILENLGLDASARNVEPTWTSAACVMSSVAATFC